MIKHWRKAEKTGSVSQKIVDRIRPAAPVKTQIESTQRELEKQIRRLDEVHEKMRARDREMFNRIVEAQRSSNVSCARVYANELHEVRKTAKLIRSSKLAFEQAKLRLDTIADMGDIVVTLSPCMSVIRGLSPVLSGMVPGAAASMQDLSSMLGDILQESSVSHTGELVQTDGMNSEAMAIIEEASATVVGQARATIPEVPKALTQQVVAGSQPSRAVTKAPKAPLQSGTVERQPATPQHTEQPKSIGESVMPGGVRQQMGIEANSQRSRGIIPDVPEELKREIVRGQRVSA
jgi:division protein CdvB (Snf7/Vps24/ESCRT-III family)